MAPRKKNDEDVLISEVKTLNIGQILELEDFQVRAKLDIKTIEKYTLAMRNGAEFPPIEVADIDGALVLVDGWHRLAAHSRNNHYKVKAKVTKCSKEQALWMAGQANLTHGLPLKRAERRQVFRNYIRAKMHHKSKDKYGKVQVKSLREIATDLGGIVRHNTVRIWINKDFPSLARFYRASSDRTIREGDLAIEESPIEEDLCQEALRYLHLVEEFLKNINEPSLRGDVIQKLATIHEAAVKDKRPWEYVELDF